MAIWIDKEFLVATTPIDSNVEWSKIEPIVDLCQTKYILPLLGTNLYSAIDGHITAYITSSTAIPTDYKLLIDNYLRKILAWYTIYESSLAFKYRYENKGVMVKNSENSQPAEDKGLELIMNGWKSNAEMYGDLMIKYISPNSIKYPEYYNNQAGNVFPRYTSYDVDIFLGTNVEGKKYYGNNNPNNPAWQ